MEFSLSSEQEMIIDSVRSFVEQELYPHEDEVENCLLYTSPSPRDATLSRMPSSA